MGREAGQGDGTGGTPGPVPVPAQPGGGAPGAPDPAGFAVGGGLDACVPSAALAVAAEAAAGARWRCQGLSRDEMTGLLRQWQALESWAAASKLGVLRALIRDEDQPLPGGSYRGDLPEGWTKSLTYEVAAALAMSATSAENLMWLAWDLQAQLPRIGDLLAVGDLTLAKARAIDQALGPLTGEDTATAEAMIVSELAGKTHSQVGKLAEQAAITVDPESARRRREEAEQTKGRVLLFREESGAAGLSGRDLPTDQALAAHARVCERAAEYNDSGVFGDARMDQLRATAYLDLINGTAAASRIACGQLATGPRPGPASSGGHDAGDAGPGSDEPATAGGSDELHQGGGDLDIAESGDPDAPGGGVLHTADSDLDGESPSGDRPSGGTSPGGGPATPSSPPRLTDLALPLATLLGLADRPGEGHGLGPLDPDLCRDLAAAAIASPWTRLCVTVTDPDGIAVGHGCARLSRRGAKAPTLSGSTGKMSAEGTARPALPARVQLTITASRLNDLAGTTGPPGQSPWQLTCDDNPGPPGGFGLWTLTLHDGRRLAVPLEPMPTFECDHRHESHAYQPNDTLRHLVQVRDGECTFPPCSRHARETDFEHAIPYGKCGKTCACNAGSRSRQCHRVKQAPGWNVTQPKPGWHQWTTPTGRTYTQGPKRYPV